MIMTWGFTFGEAKQPLQTAQKSERDGQIRPFFLQTAQKIYSYDSVRMMRSRPVAKV